MNSFRRLRRQRPLPVSVARAGEPGKVPHGVLSVIDNTVDTATGTIAVKAALPNRDRVF